MIYTYALTLMIFGSCVQLAEGNYPNSHWNPIIDYQIAQLQTHRTITEPPHNSPRPRPTQTATAVRGQGSEEHWLVQLMGNPVGKSI